MKKPTVAQTSCKDCYWYRPTPAKGFGYCRRFPPEVMAIDEDGAVLCEQPIVEQEHDTCGEFANGPKVVN